MNIQYGVRMTNKSLKKKVIVEVKGGLGNQMFQYAAARSLSLQLGANLVVEKKLGFLLDRQYHRKFELAKLPTQFTSSNLINSLPFFFDRVMSFVRKRFGHDGVIWKSEKYLFERNFSYTDLVQKNTTGKRYLMSGYFQDPRYFSANKEKILSELTPPLPAEEKYLELAKLSESHNLIALGIRIFEESSVPEAHAKDGVTKTIRDFELALSNLLDKVSNPLILVFTTHEFDFLESMNLPKGTIFVNSDRDFTHAIDSLWLLSKCQHHIFNNSTFYWWGATLSQTNFRNIEQKIYCADNFLNPDIAYPNWNRF